MGKISEQIILKGTNKYGQKYFEHCKPLEKCTLNYLEISSHPSENDSHQEYK